MDNKCVKEGFARLTVALAVVVFGLASLALGAEYSLIIDEFDKGASVITAGPSLLGNFPPSRRSRPVTLTPLIAIPDGLAQGDMLTLNLFHDTVYTARIDRVSVNINGTVTAQGRIEGYSLGYVLISTTGDCSLGSVRIPEKGEYYVIQSQPDVNQHYLFDVDVAQLEKLPEAPTTPIPPPPTPEEAAEMEMLTGVLAGGLLDPATIDVMVVYTPASLIRLGNVNNVNSFIGNTIANANFVLNNSNTILTMNLVYSAEVNYIEDTNSYIDIDRLTYTNDGYMDVVHTWRDQYFADLVVLFTDVNDVGGLGWLLDTTSGRPQYGFSLTSVRWGTWAIDNFVTIHELGHNMGCHHYKWQSDPNANGPGLFSYSAGWRWIGNDSNNYCSVMSYEEDGYGRVAHFSNPSILYQGVATGHSADGDNARTIRETKHVVAAYRQPTCIPIATKADLLAMAANTADYNNCFILTADIDMEEQVFTTAIIAADTDNSNYVFDGTAFTGTFDGNGHKIIHFTINGGSNFYLGLFGYIGSGGSVKNLGLENCTVSGSSSPSSYVGSLVGYNRGSISNCYSTGAVSGSSYCYYVGGLVGSNGGGSISRCYSTGSISGWDYVGGLVGHNSFGSISNCYSMGSVNCVASGSGWVGGLVGKNGSGGSISNCYSTGTVSGPKFVGYVGGLVGDNTDGSISRCYSTGAVSCSSLSYFVGGLVGHSNSGSVSDCYSTGAVSGDWDIGGLVGRNSHASISRCYSTGTVSSSSGSDYVGGLVGYNIDGSISSCYFLVTSGPNNGYGQPLTDAQMRQQSSFPGWDFTNETANGTNDYWRMCVDGVDYPRLNWESMDGDFACPDGVNIEDLDYFVKRWLLADCTLSNNYCGGADINGSGVVEFVDFAIFAQHWLEGI